MAITLTREAWKRFAPRCPQDYADALFSSIDKLSEAGMLDNELRWCHFAATVYEETGDFREIRESLRYTKCSTLRSTWPSRFGHRSDDELRPLLKNERALAAAVYCGRMGNKTQEDAFAYRGGGWIQTTGRSVVEGYCAKLGIEASPSTLDDPLMTLRFAILEWTEAKCNQWADENSIRKVAKAINTGSATSNVEPVGLDDRKKAFARAWAIWGETGTADAPVKIDEVIAKGKETIVKYGGPAVVGTGATVHGVNQMSKPDTAPAQDTAIPSAAATIEKARAAVDKGKQVREIAQDAKGLIPGIKPNDLLVYGVPIAIVAAVAGVILYARRTA